MHLIFNCHFYRADLFDEDTIQPYLDYSPPWNDEYEEMLLKSRVVRRAISDWVTQATFERTQHIPCADDVGIS